MKVTPCKTHDHSKNFVFYLKCQGKPWEDFEQDITGSYLGVKVLLWLLCRGWIGSTQEQKWVEWLGGHGITWQIGLGE